MAWTDIGPTETAAALLTDLLVVLDAQRQVYERTGAPVTAANKALVMDEVFEAWKFLCAKDPLPQSAEAEGKYASWVASPVEQARVAEGFNANLYEAVT